MIEKNKNVEKNVKTIIQGIRLVGILLFIFGIILILNPGGIADKLAIVDPEMNKVFGAILSIMGIIEFILTPRILESALLKRKK